MLAAFLALAVFVQSTFAVESPVRVEVADVAASPGATVPLAVRFTIPDGHHIYADMVEIVVVDAAGLSVGAAVEPHGVLRADPANPAKQREVYERSAVFELPVVVPPTATGSYVVRLLARHQACRDGLCYPAVEEPVSAKLSVMGVLAVPGISAAQAQTAGEEVSVIFSAKAGPTNTATVRADLQGEWHINKMFVYATLVEPGGYTLGEPVLPAAVKTGNGADGTAREDFMEDFDIVVPVAGPDGSPTLVLEIGYQACKGVSLCKMPTSENVSVPVTLVAAGSVGLAPPGEAAPPRLAPSEPAAPPKGPANGDAFAQAASKGTFALVLFCFLGGIAVSFTPCVLPMVPITMGIIGARGNASRTEAVMLSAAYVLGQALVYTGLGVAAGMTGALFGSWLQIPWVLGGIGLIFVALGFAMFGFYDLQVPGFVQSRISGYEKRGGYVVAFVFGLIGAVLAGPCSGPVVFGILGVIATGSGSGGVALGAALMFAFSLGMGMIFLVTGAASGWMPKRGAYMLLIKKSFGIVMWLGAIYYAAPLFSTTQTALLTAAVFLVTAVFAWPDADDAEGFYPVRVRQLYSIVGILVGAYLLLGTLVSQGFILPAMQFSGNEGAEHSRPKIDWLATEADGLAAANASGKPLMIDFTAEWCAACHEMEKYTYTDSTVMASAEGFVPVMIDCTDRGDAIVKAVQEKYQVKGLPTVVFAKADGTILGFTVGFVTAPDFAVEMEKALAAAG